MPGPGWKKESRNRGIRFARVLRFGGSGRIITGCGSAVRLYGSLTQVTSATQVTVEEDSSKCTVQAGRFRGSSVNMCLCHLLSYLLFVFCFF